MKIALTGAGGLVGEAISNTLALQGHTVIPLRFRLEAPRLQAHDFFGAQLLIHAAYDWQSRKPEDIQRINVDGSLALLEAAQTSEIKGVIFISSVSAFSGCRSLYGKGKLQVEQRVLSGGGLVVRPGMVFGDTRRGIFGTLTRLAQVPILPVFDGGSQPMWTVHREDLAKVISMLVCHEWSALPSRVIAVSAAQPIIFRDILKILGRAHSKRVAVFPVPSRLVFSFLRFSEMLGIKLPITSDALVGLLESNPSPDFHTLQKLGCIPRELTPATAL